MSSDKKSIAIALSGLFLGVVIGGGAVSYDNYDSDLEHKPQSNDLAHESQETLCVTPILIPQTVEEAKFIEQNAAALYDAAQKRSTPQDQIKLIFAMTTLGEKLAAGKIITLKKVPNMIEITQPGQSKRKSDCFEITIK